MKSLIFVFTLCLGAFLAWPYTTLYRLDQAMQADDRESIARMIDVESIRQQIKRRMNKEVESTIGEVSNSFVAWLQNGLQRLGADAINSMVNLDWAIAQLRSQNKDTLRGGFIDHLSYAFFDSPNSLLLRIGELGENPVHARLTLQNAEWRITSIYN